MIKVLLADCGYPELAEAAMDAFENAYAPYSEYRVGAALLTADGKIFTGVNIENASFGATNCAERTAFFKAVSEGEREFKAIAIAAPEGERAPFPCGVCRQVMAEFCGKDFEVIVVNERAAVCLTLEELLPYTFELQ